MPMKNPPHPGDFIRMEIIEPAGLSVTAAATALQVSRPALSSLLNSKAGLSGHMALRIEKAFGVKMDTLMRMQSSYRSEEHTSELQSLRHLVCRLLLEKKKRHYKNPLAMIVITGLNPPLGSCRQI